MLFVVLASSFVQIVVVVVVVVVACIRSAAQGTFMLVVADL